METLANYQFDGELLTLIAEYELRNINTKTIFIY